MTIRNEESNEDQDSPVDGDATTMSVATVENGAKYTGFLSKDVESKQIQNADVEELAENEDQSDIPIDRGYAWVIVFACFGMHILVVGGVKSFGVLFVEIQSKYDVTSRELGVAQGLTMTLMLALGFVANMLAVRFSCRSVMFVGGLLSSLSFILTTLIPTYDWIYFTYCIIAGTGFALSYSPCVVMVGHHFRKRRSVANGLAVSGSGIGAFTLPNLIRILLNHYGLNGCMLILAGIMLNILVFALMVRPLSSYSRIKQDRLLPINADLQIDDKPPGNFSDNYTEVQKFDDKKRKVYDECGDNCQKDSAYMELTSKDVSKKECQSEHLLHQTSVEITSRSMSQTQNGNGSLTNRHSSHDDVINTQSKSTKGALQTFKGCCGGKQLFDWSLLKNPVFLVYGLSCAIGNLGYPNVFIMMPPHVESLGQSRDNSALIMSLMGVTDLVGRIFMGWITDMNIIPKRYVFIGCLGLSGVLNCMVPIFTSVPALITYALLYGFVAGSYMAMIAVMLAESLGTDKLSSAFGLTTLGMALSLVIGPPVCGALRDITSAWNASFIFCGVMTIIGSTLPLFEPLAVRANQRKSL